MADDADEMCIRDRVWVKAKLKDPDSAQFRNLQYTPPFVCGEVNAKNSFGGYNGFERFITGTRDATFLESEVPPGDMDKALSLIHI